jgi:tRNA modification GTPase
MEALADADVVLVVLDASEPVAAEDEELLNQVKERPAVVVENKTDIASSQFSVLSSHLNRVKTSAVTGAGLPELRGEILRHVGADRGAQLEAGFLTSMRHQGLVRDALNALEAAAEAVRNHVPHEMLLLDLYNALRPLDEITGATTTDDILDLIFSTFCIGK